MSQLKTNNETNKKAGFTETTPHFGRLQPAQQPTAKQIKNSFKKSGDHSDFLYQYSFKREMRVALLREVEKRMGIEIVVDCQTKTAYPNCEYCIANKSCMIRETMETDREKKILKWLPQTE